MPPKETKKKHFQTYDLLKIHRETRLSCKFVTLPGIFFTWKHPKFARAEILFSLLSKEENTVMPAMHLRLGKG